MITFLRFPIRKSLIRFVLIFCCSWVFASVPPARAQENFSVKGIVQDEKGDPLTGANIRILKTQLGANSDIKGSFQISGLTMKTVSIQVSMIGYKTLVLNDIKPSLSPRTITVILIEEVIYLGQVDVIGNAVKRTADDTRISVQKLLPRDAKMLPGGAEDIMRSLQTLPGVMAPNDFSSQLIIRGSGPDQNLILMDNVEIFNPYRLYGAISMFNPETADDVNLISGGFPAKYGDRLSAVLDVRNRDGRSAKPLYGNLNTSLTNANFVFEGAIPFDIKGSWIISSRRTYYDLILGPIAKSTGLVSGDVAFPNFYDFQSRMKFDIASDQRLFVNGIISRDAVDIVSGSDRATPDSISIFNTNYNAVLSGGWNYVLDKDMLNSFLVSYYDNQGKAEFDGRILDPMLNREEFRGTQNDSLKALIRLFGLSVTSAFRFSKFSLRNDFNFSFAGHQFETGAEIDFIRSNIDFNLTISDELRRIFESNPRGSALINSTFQDQRYTKIHGFVQDRIAFSDRLFIQPGLRYDYYGILEKSYVSPRINASYSISPVTILRGSLGIFYQSPGYEKLFDQNQFYDFQEKYLISLEAERATHAILGLEHWVDENWLLKGETYYKMFSDLIVQQKSRGITWVADQINGEDKHKPSGWSAPYPVYADSLTSIPVNDSRGEAYGLEILLEKRNRNTHERFTGWLSYSLAWAQRYRDGYRIPFNFDQRHTINLVLNYSFNSWLEGGLLWKVGSNFPVTTPVGVQPRVVISQDKPVVATDFGGNVILDLDYGGEGNINQDRKPWYHRLDIRITAYTKFWNLDWAFYLDVINVYNHGNIAGYRYFVSQSGDIGMRQVTMFPILPTIGFNTRF